MAWTEGETPTATWKAPGTRPAMLRNALATERALLSWILRLLYAVTFGFLMVNIALHLWQQRAETWKSGAEGTLRLGTAGFALIVLSSAALVLGTITDGTGIRRGRSGAVSRRPIVSFAIAAALGTVGLVMAGALLFKV